MVKFINRYTGGEMWVNESRVKEYEEKGHKQAKAQDQKKRRSSVVVEKEEL